MTTVPRGAGRKAHAEKTARHAQRDVQPKGATTPAKPTTKAPATAAKRASKKAPSPEPLTRAKADGAYRKARRDLAGAGPEAYRKAAAKALGVTDAVFLVAYRAKDPR